MLEGLVQGKRTAEDVKDQLHLFPEIVVGLMELIIAITVFLRFEDKSINENCAQQYETCTWIHLLQPDNSIHITTSAH